MLSIEKLQAFAASQGITLEKALSLQRNLAYRKMYAKEYRTRAYVRVKRSIKNAEEYRLRKLLATMEE